TERWLALQRERLLACDHYQVIFTLPHDLTPLWLANVPVRTTLLFQAVRATLGTLLAAPKYVGAPPGILAALHTWGQTLVLHPPVHCLVTGGGLTPTGSWVAVRNGFLLPARVGMAVFRGTMVAAMTYLARYLRGGPLKNARLVAYDGAGVTFTSRARQEEANAGAASLQRMTLPVADFLQRWLLHVPVPQTRVVRCYGLYHHTHAAALAVCRTALGQPPVAPPMPLP